MAQNSFVQDAINCKAIKIRLTIIPPLEWVTLSYRTDQNICSIISGMILTVIINHDIMNHDSGS